jgi:hypothetical protein
MRSFNSRRLLKIDHFFKKTFTVSSAEAPATGAKQNLQQPGFRARFLFFLD